AAVGHPAPERRARAAVRGTGLPGAVAGAGRVDLPEGAGGDEGGLRRVLHGVRGSRCMPDLLPGDVRGFSLFNPLQRTLEFVPGQVFADVLLVDEMNRATPRTRSALPGVMAERQVMVDNVTRPFSDRFLVIAPQNPVELE